MIMLRLWPFAIVTSDPFGKGLTTAAPRPSGTRPHCLRWSILSSVTSAGVYHQDSRLPGGVHGAADANFACAIRGFASLFPTRQLGGGALSVYLDGTPVVDVWTGWADRRGSVPWSANTGAMVFSATKGLASTVIHRLVDRGLLAYDAKHGIEWEWLAMDGALGKAPLGGELTGPNPTDRAKKGRNGASSPRVRASRSGSRRRART